MKRPTYRAYCAVTLFAVAILSPVALAAEATLPQHRKALRTAQEGIINAMTDLPGGDRGIAQGADRIIAVKIEELEHLIDLQEVDNAVREPAAQKILTEKVTSQRFKLKSNCAIDINSLRAFATVTTNAKLYNQLKDAAIVVGALCKDVSEK